jgi:hypothetical protein
VNSGKTVFSQLMDCLPMYEFHKCVDRYDGHHKVKSFSCWDQYLCMAFAQLTYRESLRDVQAWQGREADCMGQVSSVISGATRLDQVLSNARAADWVLALDEFREVNEILSEYPAQG